jgi:hypothetical protein
VFPFAVAGGEINTWLTRSFIVPGDTSGTWLTDTGIGINVGVTLASGTTFNGTAGSWAGSDVRSVSGATNFMGTGAATFDVGDASLYVDPLNVGTPPPFELTDYSAEQFRCMRYYQQITKHMQNPANGTNMFVPFVFPVKMRTTPVRSLVAAGTITNASITSEAGSLSAEGFFFQVNTTAAGGFVRDRIDAFSARF